jgi:hypothetical protein
MPQNCTVIRDISPEITTFSVPFNRFAPFGFRNFVAVGNRSTAIRLHNNRILLLNPVPLEPKIQATLTALGGVDFIASDLGHHLSVKSYLDVWPDAKTIGVPGLEKKRKDVQWDFICGDWMKGGPEEVFGFSEDIETVFFEGFITYCVAWYHKPSKTLIQSDLMMNLPCTEVCSPPPILITCVCLCGTNQLSNTRLHRQNKVRFRENSQSGHIRDQFGRKG